MESSSPQSKPDPSAIGDMPAGEFRRAMHRVADMVADYLENVRDYPVLPKVAPGDVRSALPAGPPALAEPIDTILDDYKRIIEPNITHWNHPGFMAYFAVTGSGPGILGEALSAGLNLNAMLWRTAPAATELEELVCDWLRQMIGLPPAFVGHINDTASVSSLVSLAAARHRLGGWNIRQRGMAGRPDLPPLVIYASEHAHSSIEKAAITLGIGLDNVRHIPADDAFRMRPDALAEAIARDRAAGRMPMAVVATVGTTSTTSIDPLPPIVEICRRENLWLHVDAAYAGSAAICPEYRAWMEGIEQADSIVLNPHKWLCVPVDCSVLLVRDPKQLRDAFSLVPEYLRTSEAGVTNLMDYGVQLGRRFRALKVWLVIRTFGVQGLQARIRGHCAMAQELAGYVKESPDFELCAPVPFSTVCFRAVPAGSPEDQDRFNEHLLADINAAGPVFLSHTRLRGRYVLRACIGNLRARPEDVPQTWKLIRRCADRLLERTG
jgi:aromatic-L-amino-acid decarboxylase